MSDFDASLDLLEMSNHEDPSAPQRVRITDVPGWYGGAPVRTETTPRPQGDGAHTPGKSYRDARTFQILGIAEGASVVDALMLYDELAGISPTGQDIELTVTDELGTRMMRVRVAGTPEVSPFHPRRARFNLPVLAYDPRKLGPVRRQTVGLEGARTPGSGLVYPLFGGVGGVPNGGLLDYGTGARSGLSSAVNEGKAPDYPVFLIQGGGMQGGFEIIDLDTGAILRYTGDVADGQVLLIDTANGRVLADGVNDYTGFLTRNDGLSVPPGSTKTFRFRALGSTTGAPTLTVDTRNAWW